MKILFKWNLILLSIFMLFVAAEAKDYWGAIAMDQSKGITGTTSNFDTEKLGKSAAIKMCKKKGGRNCKVVAFWANGCAAAAWSPKNQYARAALAETSKETAKLNALKRCIKLEQDQNCKVVSSVCTNWETVESTLIWW